jgi:predicted transcriptional regulator
VRENPAKSAEKFRTGSAGLTTRQWVEEKLGGYVKIAARREAAIKLIEGGMSQRQASKVLGVNQATISRDVMQGASKRNAKSITGSAATKARRAKVAAKAAAKGVTAIPAEKYRIVYADPPWDYGAHAQPDYQTEQRGRLSRLFCEAPYRRLGILFAVRWGAYSVARVMIISVLTTCSTNTPLVISPRAHSRSKAASASPES